MSWRCKTLMLRSYEMSSGTAHVLIQKATFGAFAGTLFLLGAASFLPTAVFYIFATSSQAPGLALATFAALGLAGLAIAPRPSTRSMINAVIGIAMVLAALLAHGLLATFVQPIVFSRMMASLGLLGLMLVGSFLLSFSIFDQADHAIKRAVQVMFYLFIAIGAAGAAGIRPVEAVDSFNPVFPFNEPSHYALTFTPFLLCFCVLSNHMIRLVALVATLAIAYLLQSLSLVVGVLLVSLICLPVTYLAAGGGVLFLAIGFLDITYFLDRLDLNYDSGNLSVLVYIQGWELATDSVRRSSGWGIGFQQLGFGPINSPTADIIYRLAGNDANLKDGGFTLAKITSELGVIGFCLMAFYAVLAVRNGWILRSVAVGRTSEPICLLLALSLVSGYVVEAFIRGIGYFSGSTMLVLAALLFDRRFQKQVT
jgi:hypothetical protein